MIFSLFVCDIVISGVCVYIFHFFFFDNLLLPFEFEADHLCGGECAWACVFEGWIDEAITVYDKNKFQWNNGFSQRNSIRSFHIFQMLVVVYFLY